MAAHTQGESDYYVWEVAGKPVVVHLHFDVVDRILADVMRGFGALPKRGAEVGGILLGSIEDGDPTVARVDDFEAVEPDYIHGPSYLFDGDDRARFEDACRRWAPDDARDVYAVGFYRSHTREAMSLAPEDLDLMDQFFSSPAHIALLVKPYGTKVSIGGFFVREDGVFPPAPPLEFPFRRRELGGGDGPPRRGFDRPPQREPYRGAAPFEQTRQRAAARSGLRSTVWIPLSFVFLLFGLALGFMIALARGSGPAAVDAQDFSLGLSVSRSDDNLNVRWDREAPGIRTAERGVLEIEDGSYTKSVDLDTVQLKNGSIIYRNSSNVVHFRLVVYPRPRVSVTETMDWKN